MEGPRKRRRAGSQCRMGNPAAVVMADWPAPRRSSSSRREASPAVARVSSMSASLSGKESGEERRSSANCAESRVSQLFQS
jgi:hypothetical protein